MCYTSNAYNGSIEYEKIKKNNYIVTSSYTFNDESINSQGGANYYYYIYYASNSTITQYTIWEKYAETGSQSSSSHPIELEVRPIIKIKTGIYENGGTGSNSTPWKMTN